VTAGRAAVGRTDILLRSAARKARVELGCKLAQRFVGFRSLNVGNDERPGYRHMGEARRADHQRVVPIRACEKRFQFPVDRVVTERREDVKRSAAHFKARLREVGFTSRRQSSSDSRYCRMCAWIR